MSTRRSDAHSRRGQTNTAQLSAPTQPNKAVKTRRRGGTSVDAPDKDGEPDKADAQGSETGEPAALKRKEENDVKVETHSPKPAPPTRPQVKKRRRGGTSVDEPDKDGEPEDKADARGSETWEPAAMKRKEENDVKVETDSPKPAPPARLQDIEYCQNQDTDKMGTCYSKSAGQKDKLSSYKHLSRSQEDKLNSILEEIVTKAGVDFSNPELQDILSAVSEMIERIKTGINERGLFFSISRTEVCGSMAEITAMWKRSRSGIPYIEFDFLAVLKAACDIRPCCQECFYVNTPPMNLDLLEKYYRSLYNSCLKDEYERKLVVEEYFTRETNNCLASCGCQKVQYPYQTWKVYTFEPSSTQQGCDKCTVDRPTGTLRVKTSVEIGEIDTRVDCTLLFQWTSKAKTLCTRDRYGLSETEKMDNLSIRIDFLPAIKVFQSKQQSADVAACSSSGLVSNPTSSEYEHYCFLVPKRCVVCDDYSTWRRSGCRAEIDTIVNKMSDKHRKCYQVLKHLTGFTSALHPINNYHLKVAVLHHNSSCSDAGEDCAECVFKVLDELQHAYMTRQLRSLHSQANLLEHGRDLFNYHKNSILISALKGAMCSAVSELDSVSSFLKKVGNIRC